MTFIMKEERVREKRQGSEANIRIQNLFHILFSLQNFINNIKKQILIYSLTQVYYISYKIYM